MPLQQIIYHMLRIFVKLERLTENAQTGKLSNYHFKTLMLWACELKPRSWWTDVVRICVELLHILAVWLNDGRCANYFIINYNLLDYYDDDSHYTQHIARKLMLITEPWLAGWFIDSYVRRCANNCDDFVSRFFDDVRQQNYRAQFQQLLIGGYARQ